jgi:tight adherence protein B
VLTLCIAVAGSSTVFLLARAARRADAGGPARALIVSARWRLPARPRAWLASALADAAVELEPEGACELWLAVVVALSILTVAIAPPLLPVAVLAGVAAGPVALRIARGRARQKFIAALPGALEQIAAGLRGGATVAEMIGALADAHGPLAADLGRVRSRARLGLALSDALASWPSERDLTAVRAVGGALAVAASVGGPAAGAIDGLAVSMRERLGAAAEARALSAQARLSAVVVGAAPAAYVALSAVVEPGSVRVLFASGTGRVCLVIGLVLEAIALVWMRRIVRDDDPS